MKKRLTAAIAAVLMTYTTSSLETPDKKPFKGGMPQYVTIDRHPVLVHEFNPKGFDFNIEVVREPKTLDYFVRRYNPSLIIGGGFHDRATRTMVGGVRKRGEELSYGIWPPVGAKLYYRVGYFGITDSVNSVANDFEVNDLVWLVRNNRRCLNKKRKINPNERVPRIAFGAKKNGNNLLVLYTGRIDELAGLMLRFGCNNAVSFDGGVNRAYLYRRGRYEIRKRGSTKYDPPNLKNVLLGYVR